MVSSSHRDTEEEREKTGAISVLDFSVSGCLCGLMAFWDTLFAITRISAQLARAGCLFAFDNLPRGVHIFLVGGLPRPARVAKGRDSHGGTDADQAPGIGTPAEGRG